jgi:16S rRNA (cytidine1402-2'-O)-methyltransferase
METFETRATLSIVATPIGNLGDITLRALQILKDADVIACEDTRVTAKLLARYDIKKPLVIFHALSGPQAGRRILSLLGEGKQVALVTDAGTPGISDPGSELVRVAREQMGNSVRIEAIPGPAAVTAALSIAGVSGNDFTFLGFLPHKKGRLTTFKEIAAMTRTCIFYESPHRIQKALAQLAELLPEDGSRKIMVAREITKIHESFIEGTPTEVADYFIKHPTEIRGEFVVIVTA